MIHRPPYWRSGSQRRCGVPPSWTVVALAALAAGGCVQRRFLIRSNPPGAVVYVDKYEIGRTPVSHDFTYYGTREIRLVKDGYQTLTVQQPIPAPWYQVPPLDFVAENLIPGEIRDVRVLDYQLQPDVVVPKAQLMERAEGLRRGTQRSQPVGPAAAPAVEPSSLPPARPQPAWETLPGPATAPGRLPPPGVSGAVPPGYAPPPGLAPPTGPALGTPGGEPAFDAPLAPPRPTYNPPNY